MVWRDTFRLPASFITSRLHCGETVISLRVAPQSIRPHTQMTATESACKQTLHSSVYPGLLMQLPSCSPRPWNQRSRDDRGSGQELRMWRKLCRGSGHGTYPLGAPQLTSGTQGITAPASASIKPQCCAHHLQSACNS